MRLIVMLPMIVTSTASFAAPGTAKHRLAIVSSAAATASAAAEIRPQIHPGTDGT